MVFVIILYDEFSARVWAQANNDGFSLVDPIPVHLALKVAIDAEGGTFKVDEVGECTWSTVQTGVGTCHY